MKINIIKEYDLSSIQHNLNADFFIVDIVIYHSKQATITWEELTKEYQTAYDTFIPHGVQLNLVNAFQVDFPQKWNAGSYKKETKIPEDGVDLSFYEKYDYQKFRLHPHFKSIFRKIIPISKDSSKTIYIFTVSDLMIYWFEKDINNHWVRVESKASAVSFPPYMYADRIPKYLRGIILIQKSKGRTMAHEMGHKLINVSHEGLDKSPMSSGKSIPGLMGYGKSKEIFRGSKGRWHKERLQKSPFLYKLRNGRKVWNPDYVKGGVYNDPIYGNFIVKPNCPLKR